MLPCSQQQSLQSDKIRIIPPTDQRNVVENRQFRQDPVVAERRSDAAAWRSGHSPEYIHVCVEMFVLNARQFPCWKRIVPGTAFFKKTANPLRESVRHLETHPFKNQFRLQIEGNMDTAVEDLSYVVRYGATRILGEFTTRGFGALARGTAVIVRSDRGHEWGTVLSTASEQTRTYLGTSEPHGRIIRIATPEDETERDRAVRAEQDAFAGCLELIRERNMQMQLVDAEQVVGGERLIFYYVSEQRVDFRDLVKGLAKRFHVRIEMRQIGIRDEAKLLADYGDCGQPVCCNTFLREMPPVSMKMAKLQKATLDPSKISGRCGRLKCCLRYEYDTYEEHRKEMPPVGATVITKQG